MKNVINKTYVKDGDNQLFFPEKYLNAGAHCRLIVHDDNM